MAKEALMFPIKDILNATEFFRNPTTNKYIPIIRQEDKAIILQKYGNNTRFETHRWQDLTNENVDPDIPVTPFHLLESLARVKPVTDIATLAKYAEWTASHAEQELEQVQNDSEH